MIKNKINNFEIGTLNYFITRAFLIGYTFDCLINLMRQDSWLIPLISIISVLIYIKLITYIINFKPEESLPNKLNILFGNKLGISITIALCIFVSFMGLANYLNINNFIHGQFLNKTPTLAISIMFIIAIIYILNKGLNTIAKTSNILFYIAFTLFLLSLTGLIPSIKLSNLMPCFQFKTGNLLKSLNCYYAFNITPILLFTIIPKDCINNPKIKKIFLISSIISTITLFCVIFATISVFGIELTSLYKYPEFHVLKNINIIGVSTRIESILVIQWIFDLFIFSVMSIYFISSCITESFKIKNINIINSIICILLVIVSNYFSKYNIFLNEFMLKWANIPISIFSTLIILIICIKIKFTNNRKIK